MLPWFSISNSEGAAGGRVTKLLIFGVGWKESTALNVHNFLSTVIKGDKVKPEMNWHEETMCVWLGNADIIRFCTT